MASGVTTPPRLLPLIREAVLSAGGRADGHRVVRPLRAAVCQPESPQVPDGGLWTHP